MKLLSYIAPFSNLILAILAATFVGLIVGIGCNLVISFLIDTQLHDHIAHILFSPFINTKAAIVYIFVIFALIFANIVGLLALRLLQVANPGKITLLSLTACSLATYLYIQFYPHPPTEPNYIVPSWVFLISIHIIAHFLAVILLHILLKKYRTKKYRLK